MLSYFIILYKLQCTYVRECKCIPKEDSVFFIIIIIYRQNVKTFYCAWHEFISGSTWGLQNKIAFECTSFLQASVDRKDNEN